MNKKIRPFFFAGMLAAGLLQTQPALAANDVINGGKLYAARCGACHHVEDNGPGPRHRGLFGCSAGSQQGYDYSDALRRSGIVWNTETLDRWLSNPNKLVPGNKMVVQLANEPKDRADLIAYLQSATGSKGTCVRMASDTKTRKGSK